MAKAALKKVETGEALPAGSVLRDGKAEAALDAGVVRQLIEGWRIKQEMARLEEALAAINQRLIEAFEPGVTLSVTGVCQATIASREAVSITDVERLKGVLGFRFTDLVKTAVSYKPEPKLIEMAADGDEPLAPAIRACLKAGASVSVSWRGAKAREAV